MSITTAISGKRNRDTLAAFNGMRNSTAIETMMRRKNHALFPRLSIDSLGIGLGSQRSRAMVHSSMANRLRTVHLESNEYGGCLSCQAKKRLAIAQVVKNRYFRQGYIVAPKVIGSLQAKTVPELNSFVFYA